MRLDVKVNTSDRWKREYMCASRNVKMGLDVKVNTYDWWKRQCMCTSRNMNMGLDVKVDTYEQYFVYLWVTRMWARSSGLGCPWLLEKAMQRRGWALSLAV